MTSRPPQIAVCGSSRADRRLGELAEAVGRGVGAAGATLICGGRGGVMAAAALGAREAGADVIGILPGDDPADANEHCTHVVATAIGQARNQAVVLSADAVIAVGGEWGTLSEIALARRFGRPVVLLDSWSLEPPGTMSADPGVERAGDPDDAVARALAAIDR